MSECGTAGAGAEALNEESRTGLGSQQILTGGYNLEVILFGGAPPKNILEDWGVVS
jgi:hypothetical protein